MIHIDSILATTDFSLAARNAAERAAMLAAAIPVRKGVLLHVLEESWPDILGQCGASSPRIKRRVADEALRSLDDLTEEIRRLSHFNLESQIRIGKVLDVIAEAAADYSLLVLGARGRHPIRAFTLGTTSQRLLNKTQQSVLVVKRRPNSAYQRILV
ncbi:MAG: universal stress protein, partial [Smithella sp.]